MVAAQAGRDRFGVERTGGASGRQTVGQFGTLAERAVQAGADT
jgi:hypothetical protein